MFVQHCLQMGSFSPLTIMYNFMFSLLHMSFQGFWHCSKHVASVYPSNEVPFKGRPEPTQPGRRERLVKVNTFIHNPLPHMCGIVTTGGLIVKSTIHALLREGFEAKENEDCRCMDSCNHR